MWRKLAVSVPVLLLAVGILSVSIFRTADIKYGAGNTDKVDLTRTLGENDVNIDYPLPYTGSVLPDSPLWPLKALRDKIWLFITSNSSRKSELMLLFADKRIQAAQTLFRKGKTEIGFSVLTKAEKYLAEAGNQEQSNRQKGIDTSKFLVRIANASLKHYQIIREIEVIAPETVKPLVISLQTYPKDVYEASRNALLGKHEIPPENPFDW